MKGKWVGVFLMSVLAAAMATTALAIDHKNLDENRPLRLQDAYPVAHRELALEAGGGFSLKRRASDYGFFPIEVVYGALPNLQLELGSTLFTEPHDIDEPTKSGDLNLGALYNFNQETLVLPAFGIKGSIDFPTGIDSDDIDFELTGLITKSIYRLSLHFNASYEYIGGARSGEHEHRYKFVFGPSYPVGAPRYTRTTLLADIFVERASHRGDREVVGGEIGFRHQLRERIVVDAGLGSEFTGPSDRSPFFIMSGLSVAF